MISVISPQIMSNIAITLEELLIDPIKSGYLLAFSESEYNAENIRYLIEIDKFRDYLSLDKISWDNNYSNQSSVSLYDVDI